MKGFTINELSIGQEATWTKTITEADVLLFGAVSGDVNPAHFNEEYAKNTSNYELSSLIYRNAIEMAKLKLRRKN